jgi:hypothetical protein
MLTLLFMEVLFGAMFGYVGIYVLMPKDVNFIDAQLWGGGATLAGVIIGGIVGLIILKVREGR